MKIALALGALALAWVPSVALTKPIAFARGTTVMAEHGAGTMNEFQLFHAPRYWVSAGVGWTELESEDGGRQHRYSYVRANLLARRWNLPGAQANVFAWGGLGTATGNDFAGSELSRNVGLQVDYETRRVYSSFKTDLHESASTSHRIDTLQLGWAPYAHDYDTLATWIVLQGRATTGDISNGTEAALLLRFFKGGTWFEVGANADGKLQTMLMFNF